MSVLTTGASDGDAGSVTSSSRPDPEVPAKAKRRVFTAAFKKKVLAEYDAAVEGTKGRGAAPARSRHLAHLDLAQGPRSGRRAGPVHAEGPQAGRPTRLPDP